MDAAARLCIVSPTTRQRRPRRRRRNRRQRLCKRTTTRRDETPKHDKKEFASAARMDFLCTYLITQVEIFISARCDAVAPLLPTAVQWAAAPPLGYGDARASRSSSCRKNRKTRRTQHAYLMVGRRCGLRVCVCGGSSRIISSCANSCNYSTQANACAQTKYLISQAFQRHSKGSKVEHYFSSDLQIMS